MKRFLCAFLALLMLFGGTRSASAMSSPPAYWSGVRQAGVVPADSECPLQVEHMLLTFDLQNFANPHTSSEEELAAYTGQVTAQYTFYNPTDTTVTSTLLFYVGYTDDHYNHYDMDAHKYDILVDGKSVNRTLCSMESNPSGKYPSSYSKDSLWFAYEITIEPGQRIVNTVTAPIYPSIYTNYEPQKYDYYYHPVPDFTWSKFGTMDVVINTPFHLLYSEFEKVEQTGTGYKATVYQDSHDNHPSECLYFQLCASENPEIVDDGDGLRWIFVLLLIISPFVYIAKALNSVGEFIADLFQNLF